MNVYLKKWNQRLGDNQSSKLRQRSKAGKQCNLFSVTNKYKFYFLCKGHLKAHVFKTVNSIQS